jgi:hypothetical protein
MLRRTKLASGLAAITLAVGLSALPALAGPVGVAGGFEDDDANLVDDAAAGIDWNSFSPVTWSPHPATTPTRTADKTALGFKFKGIEDWQATTSDTGFAGGTKQDDICPSVITAKAPNKDDLKRIYLASTTGSNGHTYLNLAWVRIPQNTTSPSAHVAFEFNKGTATPAGCGSGGLLRRVAGDMLIVYDFEGGAGDAPVLTLRKWVTSGACEVSSDSAPCWGLATNLTAGGFAEGAVNTGSTVLDQLTPPALSSTTGTSVSSTLGLSEFGEAGIDLTGAGVFTPGTCETFGNSSAVSRTSGNSGTAQMKDLVGPAPFLLTNCGSITIIKHTDPRGLNQDFGYTTTGGLSPSTFTLNDNGNTTGDSTANTRTYTDLAPGGYSVTENADPAGFAFDSLTCTDSTGNSTTTSGRTATITVVGGGSTTCTYVNKQQLGAIKITKTGKDKSCTGAATPNANCKAAGVRYLSGVTFAITKGGTAITNSPFTTNASGVVCVDNLAFGTDYSVTETGAPTGWSIDDSTAHSVTVDNNAKCSDSIFGGETLSFSDTPLSSVQVKFTSLAGSGVTAASIVCADSAAATVDPVSENGSAEPALDDTDETITNLKPGTYTCTVVVDP